MRLERASEIDTTWCICFAYMYTAFRECRNCLWQSLDFCCSPPCHDTLSIPEARSSFVTRPEGTTSTDSGCNHTPRRSSPPFKPSPPLTRSNLKSLGLPPTSRTSFRQNLSGPDPVKRCTTERNFKPVPRWRSPLSHVKLVSLGHRPL
jgi:hypothetical protein